MRAFLGVYDKTGIVDLGQGLHELGWELIATGGTQRTLARAGLPAVSVAEYTGSPEMLGGRVKTLHPKIHAGLLYRREHPGDEAEMASHHIPSIDLSAGNFYPFVETVSTGHPTLPEALEKIDIGGPAMLRAAAKNHLGVIPLIDHNDYQPVLAALRAAGGSPSGVSVETRRQLAAKAFQWTARYDTAIAAYLSGNEISAPSAKT